MTEYKASDASLLTPKAKVFQEMHWKYGCQYAYPLPMVAARGEGIYVWDVDGKRYMDFINGYSALNHGHCHPKIMKAVIEQLPVMTLSGSGFFNNETPEAEKFLCETFGYQRCLLQNTGCEGVETAVKIARKWGYDVKKVEKDKAMVVMCKNNYWGRSIAASSSSDDPYRYRGYGPFNPGFTLIDYNSPAALEEKLHADPNIVAFIVEPVQGEGGVIVPNDGYLKACSEICKKYNVLFVADEIQTGLGRAGRLYCCQYEDVKPDILILGKALSGGVMAISAILTRDEVMLTIHPGEHGSTFAGMPLAAHLIRTSVRAIIEEKLPENSFAMGNYFRELLKKIKSPLVKEIRGKGLLSVVELNVAGWQMCLNLLKRGVIAKPTHESHVRLSPPLVINKAQIEEAAKIVEDSIAELDQQLAKKTADINLYVD